MRISDWSSDVCSSDRLGQARLGVAHRGSVIAVDVAEIALAVDQREAQREILRQAHQGVIDGLVAVRVELADHVADHPGGLLDPGIGVEAKRSEEHTSELQSLMRISYAVFCLKKKNKINKE